MTAPGPGNPWTGTRDRRRPHPAPRARLALMIAIVVEVLSAFATLVWLIAELRLLMDKSRVPTQPDLERAALAFKTLAVVMSLSVLSIAIWIGHFAWRIQCELVYPPPGSRHLRVKRVRRGREALRVAYVCYTVAGMLTVAAAAITPVAFQVMRTLRL